jgi:hypothetical protein
MSQYSFAAMDTVRGGVPSAMAAAAEMQCETAL